MPLRPPQVHPEEHLGPVGRFRAAGAGADRENRAAAVVLAAEEQGGSFSTEVALERRGGPIELRGQLRIAGLLNELEGREQIVDAGLEPAPQLDLGPEAVGLAEDLLGTSLVVPEPGFAGQRLELGDPAFLRRKVKDAPRSTGSARPGRGLWTRPLVPGLEVLQQDRTELDQAQGRLAPGDDGVHAGTVGVVGAHAAVAVTVERRCVAARSAVTLAGDEIDERCFLGLLQLIPHIAGGRNGARHAVRLGDPSDPEPAGIARSIARRSPISKREKRSFRSPNRSSWGQLDVWPATK
jgi:hypothetical protein